MLLIPFVENSFKHGLGKDKADGYVQVQITIEEDSLHFGIANSQPSEGISTKKGYQGGIGLINVRKRLELLYPKNHTLKITNIEKEFNVELIIKLN